MRAVLTGMIATVVLASSAIAALAGAKECKPGYEYDEAKGKCVVIRGS